MEPKFPQIPTDNLFKFMAVAGIAIFLLSYLPFFHIYKLRAEIIHLEGDSKILDAEAGWARAIAENPNATDKLSAEKSMKLDNSLLDKPTESFESQRKLTITTIQIRTKLNEIEHRLKWIQRESRLSTAASLLGGFVALAGFYLWYTRLQRPQDKIIRLKAASKERSGNL